MHIQPPPTPSGDLQEQIRQCYRYLYRLQEQLNAIFQGLQEKR